MNDIAVVICNFNKKEYLAKNIDSLKKQTMGEFDIFVVDNASTDQSADFVKATYPEINVICNEENLGGTGGFNTGIRAVIKYPYRYIILLDNDIVLKEDCIETLYEDMESNPNIGIMGAKILKMDYPDIIQEFAPVVNYSTMTFELSMGGEKDRENLPHFTDCDYVPACALIARRDVVDKIGCMPDENFIYYDDIVWGVRCHRAGYRVVADSKAVVWHKGGAVINPTSFASYYLNRNKNRFFMTYKSTEGNGDASPQEICERVDFILKDMFEGIYACEYKKLDNLARSRFEGFTDALEGKLGKTEPYKIRKVVLPEDRFDVAVNNSKTIKLYMNGLWECTRRIANHVNLQWGSSVKLILVDDKYAGDKMLGIDILACESAPRDSECNLVLQVCRHIYELEISGFDHCYIDGWRNVILNEKDFDNYKAYAHGFRVFKLCFEEKIRAAMREIGGDYKNA
ncbi:MAG: glycosyltransferase family 2 protein [Lachnospiraceae bacterium]|nr:glycosyltransferase family 2 protein [Lachnospiraceae bacterium]